MTIVFKKTLMSVILTGVCVCVCVCVCVFAVLMWLLTYVGALFNGLTLLLLAVVCVFTVPLVYEKYQKQIDQYLGLVRTQVNSVMTKLREKVPGAKRKGE
ncbi:hypothetical protein AMELA_G00042900 [Ameiurus melas]|uniref:Reticulon n=1 Tax=Ameiurus melas TaxID=219545 RepID=A0A7J6B438_AMEME|nr:hypothetical protein AMELA_G00042900 [Ameiurus melas]